MVTRASYCRICQASCGVLVDVEDNRILKITGDRDNALSGGFTCPKGRRGGDFLQGPGRLTTSLRRNEAGELQPVDVHEAIGDIAQRLQAIIEQHGSDAVGLFQGTQTSFATLTPPFMQAWFRALGSHKHFSTMTIDQSAKWIVPLRMGEYVGGRQRFDDADVWLLAGTNPLVSVNGGNGDAPLMHDPSARIRDARRRGLQLIVIDPRRTETAARADIHLQPRPGHDAILFAGLLNVILTEKLHNADFCARYVDGVDDLRRAVAPVTPEFVESCAGVPAADFVHAARTFGVAGRGMVSTGTGVCMGPHSNLAEHLAISLNVVCGRYLRPGEAVGAPAALQPMRSQRAEVTPPDRTWDRGFHSRVDGTGQIHAQLPSSVMADEILQPGPDRVRALIVSGGNPVSAMPGHEKILRALQSLDLLVVIDPRLTETSRLADFVIAPTLSYERPDHTAMMEGAFPIPFAQFAAPLVAPPAGVIEDWEFFFHLGAAMGLTLRVAGQNLGMSRAPTSEELLDRLAGRGRISLDEVRGHPHGVTLEPAPTVVEPSDSEIRLQLLPADVGLELEEAIAAGEADRAICTGSNDLYPFRLAVRRMREVMNSLGRDVAGLPEQSYNPAYVNPDQMQSLGFSDGQVVELRSAHGRIRAVVTGDSKVRFGVVSMTHCWGGDTEESRRDPRAGGSNVNRLLTTDGVVQSINRMPTMSGVPVAMSALAVVDG